MSTNKIIIAIDGYSSSGKSTMAKRLAAKIGYRYIDSGAMYRAVTLYGMQHDLVSDGEIKNLDRLIESLPEIKIDFVQTPSGQHTLLNGLDVEQQIRSLDVSNAVSPVSAIPEIRAWLTEEQKQFGVEKGIVMDGRDIGTTVFPDAELKIFVEAPAEVRAIRRLKELLEKGEQANYEDVLENVKRRDYIDSHREVSPLRKADDAVTLDNSSLSREEQDQLLFDLYNLRASAAK